MTHWPTISSFVNLDTPFWFESSWAVSINSTKSCLVVGPDSRRFYTISAAILSKKPRPWKIFARSINKIVPSGNRLKMSAVQDVLNTALAFSNIMLWSSFRMSAWTPNAVDRITSSVVLLNHSSISTDSPIKMGERAVNEGCKLVPIK